MTSATAIPEDSYATAQSQLRTVAAQLNIDPGLVEILSQPKRELTVYCPVQMDNGTTKVFTGYRIQHNDARGPVKGGLRFSLATGLHVLAAHERRHLWQAWNVRRATPSEAR